MAMHSNFETSELSTHQHMMMDTNSSSPLLPIFFNPQNQNQQQQHVQHHQQHSNHLVSPIPITHQLFQGLHQQQPSTAAHWQMGPVNFKLGLNDNTGAAELSDHLLAGNNPTFLQPRPHNLGFTSWQSQEFIATKQPFRKPDETEGAKHNHRGVEEETCKELANKYKLYGELEAICSLAKIGEAITVQTGSGSALTNENAPKNVDIAVPFGESCGLNVGAPAAKVGVDDGSEASTEEKVSFTKVHDRKRKKEDLSSSSTTQFFEGLVKRVMNHQESLHNKYLALVEKMERERMEREEAWRHQEAEKHKREAIAQRHELALASKREALMVSYVEKITGQKVSIPSREIPIPLLHCDHSNEATGEELTPLKADQNSRWPQSEVEALILERSNLESKFQEPGAKWPLWEQVSASMATLGYQRSAKRCKEKWENINKYFRKTKASPKKRSKRSKTCSYFNQLDQLYSRAPITNASSSSYCCSNPSVSVERQRYSELLQAVITGRDTGVSQNLTSGHFELISEMGSNSLDFDGLTNRKVENLQENYAKMTENEEDHGSLEDEEGEEDTDGDDSDE